MRFGVEMAAWGRFADPRELAAVAREVEAAGWDGLFLWDAMLHDPDDLPKADPWIALAAVAMATERIRIGPMVTPLPRRRPWKLAREAVTLDHLSGGRLTLGVGLGDPTEEEFGWFGEAGLDHRTRAAMLDEGLAILDGLWSGEPFAFAGEHYALHEMTFLPRPVQTPRIPIWVAGSWPNKAPMRRAARWDGVHPFRVGAWMTPEDVRGLVAYVGERREGDPSALLGAGSSPFDVVVQGSTQEDEPARAAERVRASAEAGATWWLETCGLDGRLLPEEEIERLIRRGPPGR